MYIVYINCFAIILRNTDISDIVTSPPCILNELSLFPTVQLIPAFKNTGSSQQSFQSNPHTFYTPAKKQIPFARRTTLAGNPHNTFGNGITSQFLYLFYILYIKKYISYQIFRSIGGSSRFLKIVPVAPSYRVTLAEFASLSVQNQSNKITHIIYLYETSFRNNFINILTSHYLRLLSVQSEKTPDGKSDEKEVPYYCFPHFENRSRKLLHF